MNAQSPTNETAQTDRGTRWVHVRKLPTLLGWGLAIVLALWFFPAFQLLLLGVLAAASVACALWPIVVRMHRSRVVAAVSVGVGFIVVVAAAVTIIVMLLSKPIAEEIQRLPQIRQDLDHTLGGLSQRFDISPPVDTSILLSKLGKVAGGGFAATLAQILVNVGVALAFVFIGSIYFLAEPRDNLIGLPLKALPPRRRRQVVDALDELGPKLRGWLIGVLVSMSVVAVVSGIGYSIAGLKFAIPLALLAGLCELVPTVGPIVGGIVAILVAVTQGPGQVAGAALTWAVVQIIESYLLLPLIMRRAVEIPAVVTLFTVILWGEVFGPAGLFLAIPINLLIWVLFKHLVIQEGDEPTTSSVAQTSDVSVRAELEVAAAHPT